MNNDKQAIEWVETTTESRLMLNGIKLVTIKYNIWEPDCYIVTYSIFDGMLDKVDSRDKLMEFAETIAKVWIASIKL